MIPKETIDKIFETARVEEVVGDFVTLKRRGVNLLGNCLATVVVARWEGEFDDVRASVFGTPNEKALDLAEGEVAFAEAEELG